MSYKKQLQEYLSVVELEKLRTANKYEYHRSMMAIERDSLVKVGRLIKTLKSDIKKEK